MHRCKTGWLHCNHSLQGNNSVISNAPCLRPRPRPCPRLLAESCFSIYPRALWLWCIINLLLHSQGCNNIYLYHGVMVHPHVCSCCFYQTAQVLLLVLGSVHTCTGSHVHAVATFIRQMALITIYCVHTFTGTKQATYEPISIAVLRWSIKGMCMQYIPNKPLVGLGHILLCGQPSCQTPHMPDQTPHGTLHISDSMLATL